MSYIKLKDRIENYQNIYDYKLLGKVPIIISVNGRGFTKITSLVKKPYCEELSEVFLSTTLKLCNDIDGAVFAYHFSDEIVLVIRNDQTPETLPWYDNKIQKISSIIASNATLHFNKIIKDKELNLLGDPLFITNIFVVPNIVEAINTIIYKQQYNFHVSLQFACFYELLKKNYDKNSIKEMLANLTADDKINLLLEECSVDFNQYPLSFRRGVACYKVPKVINDVVKNKWSLNTSLPIFSKDQAFLSNIFKNGADIFRAQSNW